MRTVVWSVLHLLVDMVCAWAMYAFFCDGNYGSLLVYNFCAFALQLPFGTLLDLQRDKYHSLPTACASLGVILTACGAFLHPSILGIGNALFHTGAGVDVIEGDFLRGRKGQDLGVFVAPGAIGLYFGMLLGKNTSHPLALVAGGIVMLLLAACQWTRVAAYPHREQSEPGNGRKLVIVAVCCFAVVIVRSYIGLAVSFPWKSVSVLGAAAVFSAAAGKCCGGFLAARFGLQRVAAITLLLATVCYLLGDHFACGLAAVLFFNMSMPLTLYLLADKLPGMPGFAFGLLTFGLFLGFLPVYWHMDLMLSPNILGAAGSALSCALLIAAGKVAAYDKLSS